MKGTLEVGLLSLKRLSEGGLKGAPLLGTPKDMLSKALEMVVCFHGGPRFWGTWSDALFLGPLREGNKFFI